MKNTITKTSSTAALPSLSQKSNSSTSLPKTNSQTRFSSYHNQNKSPNLNKPILLKELDEILQDSNSDINLSPDKHSLKSQDDNSGKKTKQY